MARTNTNNRRVRRDIKQPLSKPQLLSLEGSIPILAEDGILRIRLSNRNPENSDCFAIFDKDINIVINNVSGKIRKFVNDIYRQSNQKITDIECYAEIGDPSLWIRALQKFCKVEKIDLLLHQANYEDDSYTTTVFRNRKK